MAEDLGGALTMMAEDLGGTILSISVSLFFRSLFLLSPCSIFFFFF